MGAEVAGSSHIIRTHVELYPVMQARDVYKLLYQSICGAEHLMTSARAFEQYLRAEFEAETAADDEPLLVPLRMDGLLSRINLRPYKARGGSVEALMNECMLAMLPVDEYTRMALRRVWDAFVIDCQSGSWSSLALTDVLELDAWLRQRDYAALHHSEQYRLAYRPAYRLVRAIPMDVI